MRRSRAASIFAAERTRFAAVFPAAATVTLAIYARHFLPAKDVTARDLAWFDLRTRQVCIVVGALDRSEACLRGIFWHELGHAVDADIDRPGSEARADRLAKRVTGCPVRYTADGVQHSTHGKPMRPRQLHA